MSTFDLSSVLGPNDEASGLPPEVLAALMARAHAERPAADPGMALPQEPLQPVPEVGTQIPAPGGAQGYFERLGLAGGMQPVAYNSRARGNGASAIYDLLAGFANARARNALSARGERQQANATGAAGAAVRNQQQWQSLKQDQAARNARLQKLQGESSAQQTDVRKAGLAAWLKAQSNTGYLVRPEDATKYPALAPQVGRMIPFDDAARFKLVPPKESPEGGGLFGGSPQGDYVKQIADAIERGDQPPLTTGLYRYGGPVRGELGKRHFNQSQALMQWNAIQRETASMNGTQQTQTRQAGGTLMNTYDTIDELATRLGELAPQTRAIPINRVINMGVRDLGTNGVEAQKVALNLRSAIADAVPLQATVYMAGGVPSEEAMKRAVTTISADRSPELIMNDTKLQRRLMNYRLQHIAGTTAVTPNTGAGGIAGLLSGKGGSPVKMRAPDGRPLLVPPDKVAEMKSHGAVESP